MTSFAAPGSTRALWLAVFAIVAAGIAAVAGLLAHAGGDSIAKSLLISGGAFATTLGLPLALAHFAGGR